MKKNFEFQPYVGFTSDEWGFMSASLNGKVMTPSNAVSMDYHLRCWRECYALGTSYARNIVWEDLEEKIMSLTQTEFTTLLKYLLVCWVDVRTLININ